MEAAGSLRRGNFTYFPVVPGKFEFSVELRRLIQRERPDVVAVELPGSLEELYLQALARMPEISVILYVDEEDDGNAVYIPVEPCDPFTEAARTGIENGARIVFIEPDVAERPHVADRYPDPYAIRHIGLERYVDAYRVHAGARSQDVETHAAGMAWKLQGSDPMARVLVVLSLNLLDAVLDAMEVPQDPIPATQRRWESRLLNPHPDCLAEITIEYPYLQERYEGQRDAVADADLERPRVQMELLREAERAYHINTGDNMEHWQRRSIARFTRNLAVMGGDLTAGLFDLATAARSVVDDNYAWEVWEAGNRYTPQQSVSALIETVNLSGEEVWLNTRKLRLRRRLPGPKQLFKGFGLKRRKKEKFQGEWAKQTTGDAICSYPPEDLVIEEYGRFLKKKAKAMLSEERTRTEPFTTSVLDGIDIRETIRNWHEKKIYVRRTDRLAGDVGAVVVIFDEDRDDSRYGYLTTWLGEHQNESDMAFYSTFPFEHLVGPGIGRAEYGGFLMTLPARRLMDVWSDPDYEFALNKAERLLLAALDYSLERMVVYVASKPPRSIFRSVAARLRRQILYVPIGALSPARLKRLRVVHVLDNYARREEAKGHIW